MSQIEFDPINYDFPHITLKLVILYEKICPLRGHILIARLGRAI